jgi:DNA-binding XRE family transcriptional regulator
MRRLDSAEQYNVWTLWWSTPNMTPMATKHILKALGEEIRHRRKPLAMSQEALAHGAGLHRNVIGRLERGTYNPTVITLLSIAAEFDILLSELISSAERRMR